MNQLSPHLPFPEQSRLQPLTVSSTILAYSLLTLFLIYHVLQHFEYLSAPIFELVWNASIYLTPLQVISAMDSRFGTKPPDKTEDARTVSASERHAKKSEAMRRILGLDGAGIMTTVQRTRRLSGLTTSSNNPPGLGNWDNSCYQNSVIQGLASLHSLPAFLDQTSTEAISQSSTKAALKDIISRLNSPSNTGEVLWTPAELKSMSSWSQQDAQEYFSKILDEMGKENSRAVQCQSSNSGLAVVANLDLGVTKFNLCSPEKKSTLPKFQSPKVANVDRLPDELSMMIGRNPLEGLLAQRVGCLQCGYVEGLSLIPFNCLTVPLGKQWLYDIQSCLNDYTALESINGVECAKCTLLHNKKQLEQLRRQFNNKSTSEAVPLVPPLSAALRNSVTDRLSAVNTALDEDDFTDNTLLKKCLIPARSRISATKSRQAVIARVPQSLVIHVNRSVFNELSGVQSKNYADVKFPERLDLAPWCLGNLPAGESDETDAEFWNTDPSKSMLQEVPEIQSTSGSNMYELRAAITHYGRHENGHYVCYRRHLQASISAEKATDSWWRFSDEEVSEVSKDNVLSQGGVFMLFYERSELQVSRERDAMVRSEQRVTKPGDNDLMPVQNTLSAEEAAQHQQAPQKQVVANDSIDVATNADIPSTDPEPLNRNLPPPQAPQEMVTFSLETSNAPVTISPENTIASPPMRTAGPRSRRGRGSVGKGIERMVIAN